MNKTRWIIFSVICLTIIVGMIFVNQNNQASYSGDVNTVITEGPIADHTYDSNQNKVILIEYADYQCPACATISTKVNAITAKYKDQLTFVFRNLPLTTIHPNSLAAATAAEAAGLQGKYFEMHDKLYTNQNYWSGASVADRTSIFESYAQEIGLNIDQYKKDLSSSDITSKIRRDQATAKTLKLSSTPSFVLNGNVISENVALTEDGLQKAVEDALKNAGLIQ